MKLLGLGLVMKNGILLHERVKRDSPDDHWIKNVEELADSVENMRAFVGDSANGSQVVAIYAMDDESGAEGIAAVEKELAKRRKARKALEEKKDK